MLIAPKLLGVSIIDDSIIGAAMVLVSSLEIVLRICVIGFVINSAFDLNEVIEKLRKICFLFYSFSIQ